jgi:hypothetical protein
MSSRVVTMHCKAKGFNLTFLQLNRNILEVPVISGAWGSVMVKALHY